MAQNAALDGVEVVILGDSIVERFAGTRNMGRLPRAEDDGSTHDADDDKEEALSTQARSYAALRSKLNMVALGCSGDTTNHLLYHLAHGVLHPKLQPKVIVLVIGTNNLGAQAGCNARTTLAGVLQVAQFLHRERPRATIVLHALLPRTDADGEDGPLHRYWSQILWINLQLKKFSALHPDWRFMNPNSKLLRPDPDAPYKVALKPGFMPDGLHPSPEGYEIWSHELVKVVTSALDGHDNDEKSQDEKKRDRKDSGRPKGKSRRRRGESR
jgi:lysophospholipase L1-like esterase